MIEAQASTPAVGSDILTTPEAADYLKFKKSTLDAWRVAGTGPKFARLGTGKAAPIRYRRADLDAWLESQLLNSTSEAA
ncbi:helix-turn-helix transcriptional regulator [Novosphingobium colocasiae]|uniref:helix-turn-helix transcriptional regulator n=1 Tax=Novosphingobium colocasiae TaxID=1256513 RepID=UPI0035B4A31D